MRVHATRRDDLALARDDVRAAADDHALGHAVHDVRVARLADARYDARLDADVGLVDARVVDDEGVGDDEVEAVGVGAPAHLPHALAQRLAAPELALVAVRRQVPLDLDPEVRGAQAHPVARRGAEHGAVRRAVHSERLDHDRSVISQTRRWLGLVREAGSLELRHDVPDAAGVHGSRGEVVPAADGAPAGDLDERDGLGVAGLEAHRRAGRDVEAAAVRERAVEGELRVRLDEVVVAAHLYGPVAAARDGEPDAPPALVERHPPVLDHHHGAGGLLGVVRRRRRGRERVRRWYGEEAAVQRPREIPVLRRDRVVHCHEVRAGRERALDLDLVQRAHDGRAHVPAAQHRRPHGHEVRHRVLAIADQFLEVIGDEGLDATHAD